MEKSEQERLVGNAKWCSHFGKIVLQFLNCLNTELPYELAIFLLGIHDNELKRGGQTNTCTQTFIAILFTTPERCKQHQSPLKDE